MTETPRATPWNFLAGPYIDRRAEAREHAVWWDEARRDPQTRYVLARGTAQLVIGGLHPGIAFLHGGHPLVQRAAPESMLLLGWYRETRCVLIEIDETEAPADRNPAELTGLADARFEELRPLAPLLEQTEASLLAYARALSYWRRRHRYCGACGTPNLSIRAGHVLRCSNPGCAIEVFPRIDPAIIVLVTDGERALLGRQASWPQGRYSTIAGFVEPGESLEDAVAREVHEETGVQVLESRYHSSQPWPFPSSLMLGFSATASPESRPQGSDELEDARWFTREQIASGTPMLPPRTSISFCLIEHWFDGAGGFPPLREIPAVGRWETPR
ncbi:MAG: NAD(+) diphosphatase [Steroidobacteraceae bacterium]|nr:NAD(+) diphosphatase [Nevskiaceae bacterium]MCP5339283.1 NAD(+) diphosphatase [Nevskiaceae bacterium]MCP5359367.1 NAD(+) diphosphatase [Nevskiaceae bacterium]MCP5470805.1 NAD(+) diphosphatase [Nevskiaceae bacterium]